MIATTTALRAAPSPFPHVLALVDTHVHPPPPPPIAPFTSSFFTELHTEIAAKQARFKSQKGDDYFPEISFGEARVEGKPQNKVGTKALPFRS